jgi:hypothetical protein
MSMSTPTHPIRATQKNLFSVSAALREWGGICAALQLGRGTLIVRKGGLIEARRGFETKYERFLLQPTHWHEIESEGLDPKAFKGQSTSEVRLEKAVRERVESDPEHAENSTVRVESVAGGRSSEPGVCTCIAEVVGERVIESSRERELEEVLYADIGLPLATYSRRQIEKRRAFRSSLPMHILVLRVRNLTDPFDLGPAGVGGCKSWIEMDAEHEVQAKEPAVSEEVLGRVMNYVKAEPRSLGGHQR